MSVCAAGLWRSGSGSAPPKGKLSLAPSSNPSSAWLHSRLSFHAFEQQAKQEDVEDVSKGSKCTHVVTVTSRWYLTNKKIQFPYLHCEQSVKIPNATVILAVGGVCFLRGKESGSCVCSAPPQAGGADLELPALRRNHFWLVLLSLPPLPLLEPLLLRSYIAKRALAPANTVSSGPALCPPRGDAVGRRRPRHRCRPPGLHASPQQHLGFFSDVLLTFPSS